MIRAAAALALAVAAIGVHAQGFIDDGGPCYTWQGGNFSAGAFTKCPQPWAVAAPAPKPIVKEVIVEVPAAPISCAPPPKPLAVHPRHYKPPVRCKPGS